MRSQHSNTKAVRDYLDRQHEAKTVEEIRLATGVSNVSSILQRLKRNGDVAQAERSNGPTKWWSTRSPWAPAKLRAQANGFSNMPQAVHAITEERRAHEIAQTVRDGYGKTKTQLVDEQRESHGSLKRDTIRIIQALCATNIIQQDPGTQWYVPGPRMDDYLSDRLTMADLLRSETWNQFDRARMNEEAQKMARTIFGIILEEWDYQGCRPISLGELEATPGCPYGQNEIMRYARHVDLRRFGLVKGTRQTMKGLPNETAFEIVPSEYDERRPKQLVEVHEAIKQAYLGRLPVREAYRIALRNYAMPQSQRQFSRYMVAWFNDIARRTTTYYTGTGSPGRQYKTARCFVYEGDKQ